MHKINNSDIVHPGMIWQDRQVIHVETIKGTEDDWDSYARCMDLLKRMGYIEGSMERYHPIGFVHRDSDVIYVSKWTNMSTMDRKQLDGAMHAIGANWRNGTIQIVWWAMPVESPVGCIPFETM